MDVRTSRRHANRKHATGSHPLRLARTVEPQQPARQHVVVTMPQTEPTNLEAQAVQNASLGHCLGCKPRSVQKVGGHQVVHRLPRLHNLARQVPGGVWQGG